MPNEVSPIVSMRMETGTVRGGDRQASKGSKRKRMSSCNEADRGSNFALPERMQTSEWSFIMRKSENSV